MQETLKVKHSYNAGDLIVLMAGLKQLHKTTGKKITIYQVIDFPAFYYNGAESPITNADGYMVCMNQKMFEMLKPLVEYQDYIASFEPYSGQEVQFDVDLTRDSRMIPMPAGLIHHYAFSVFPEMSCDLSQPWIEVPDINDYCSNKIIVNRTQRYTNAYINYYFLKNYQLDVVFMGTKNEHEIFNKQFDLSLSYQEVLNFYDLARIMRSFKGGIYNQSFLWHLADAMKLPRILELCPQFPNTFPTGANGYAFYHQKALEFYFSKTIK